MDETNDLLDIAGAAAFLSVSETSLRRWTNSGRLACLRVGLKRERRFRRGDLLGFMEDEPRLEVSDSGVVARRGPSHSGDARSVSPLRNHLCGMYESHVGLVTLAVPFLLEGLREGSVCLLVGTARVRNDLMKFLKEKRKSVHSDIEAGRLVLAGYRNSGDAQCDYFQSQIEAAMKVGVRSFRVVGDVGTLRAKTTSRVVIEYEACYSERIAKRYPVETLCTYDARRMSGIEILDALKGHPDIARYSLDRALA